MLLSDTNQLAMRAVIVIGAMAAFAASGPRVTQSEAASAGVPGLAIGSVVVQAQRAGQPPSGAPPPRMPAPSIDSLPAPSGQIVPERVPKACSPNGDCGPDTDRSDPKRYTICGPGTADPDCKGPKF